MVRRTIYKLKNNMSIIDTQFLIVKKGGNVRHIIDKMELGLFDTNKTLEIMRRAGLTSKFMKNEVLGEDSLYG